MSAGYGAKVNRSLQQLGESAPRVVMANLAHRGWLWGGLQRPCVESARCLVRCCHVDLVKVIICMIVITTNAIVSGELSSSRGIVQLREWGTVRSHPLPTQALRCRLGTEDGCAVLLSDPEVLPVHAQLTRERQRWLIRALGDDPGLWRDGARTDAFCLEPGLEVGVGQTTLIAEDEQWMALRGFCARMLGWGGERRVAVDRALRSIRLSLTHRAPLLLRCESDAVPIAHALHRRTLGADRPFVVCDPRRRDGTESIRSAGNHRTGAAAAQAAAGGSLCVRARRLPPDVPALLAGLREPGTGTQLIVCLDREDAAAFLSEPIEVPSLSTRAQDLPRIVDEYAQDAIGVLDVPATSFLPDDRRWVLEHAATSLPEIEKATLRRVALRSSANVSRAAARLGMAPVSLSRWLARHNLATGSAVAS